jgi:hypothetical protein
VTDKDFHLKFARMLRGMAARLESGEWSLDNAWHDMSSDPRAPEAVSFTVTPRRAVDRSEQEPQGAQPESLDQAVHDWLSGAPHVEIPLTVVEITREPQGAPEPFGPRDLCTYEECRGLGPHKYHEH